VESAWAKVQDGEDHRRLFPLPNPDAAVLQAGPAAGRFMPEPADELMVSLASPGNKC